MFTKGYYTHEAFKDVFIEVLDVINTGHDCSLLTIRWWNKSQTGRPYLHNTVPPQDISIVAVDYHKWSTYKFTLNDEKSIDM